MDARGRRLPSCRRGRRRIAGPYGGPGALGLLYAVRVSVVSGGLLSMLGVGIVAVALPAFRAYDARRWVQDREAPVSRTA